MRTVRGSGLVLSTLGVVVAATLVGGALGEKLPAGADRDMPSLDEYADILTTLSDWAPEAVPPDKIVYASIHGMLSRLDPHTAFLEPDDYAAMREKQQGSFFGLGIQIQKRMGKITVIAPMEGTPAFKLGIRAGDIITHIEDEELKEEVSTDEVVRKLRGPKGTQVTITIRRAGIDEPIRMTITRAEIPTSIKGTKANWRMTHLSARWREGAFRSECHTQAVTSLPKSEDESLKPSARPAK